MNKFRLFFKSLSLQIEEPGWKANVAPNPKNLSECDRNSAKQINQYNSVVNCLFLLALMCVQININKMLFINIKFEHILLLQAMFDETYYPSHFGHRRSDNKPIQSSHQPFAESAV